MSISADIEIIEKDNVIMLDIIYYIIPKKPTDTDIINFLNKMIDDNITVNAFLNNIIEKDNNEIISEKITVKSTIKRELNSENLTVITTQISFNNKEQPSKNAVKTAIRNQLQMLRSARSFQEYVPKQEATEPITYLKVLENEECTQKEYEDATNTITKFECDKDFVAKCCLGCGKLRKLKTCTSCKIARFCSTECVQSSWKWHKPNCKSWRLCEEIAEA
jgi:hypothetical protein